jgi:adenylylsulfate kinase
MRGSDTTCPLPSDGVAWRRAPAAVVWFTGVSGSGKTTLATQLTEELARRMPVELLDGDMVREFFEQDLGYTRADRTANVKRIAFAAKLLADHGVTVVVANIAPYYDVRDFIRRHIPRYVQIFLDLPMERAVTRGKTLYERYQAGAEQNVVGLDDVYDRPRSPDLTIRTDMESPEASLRRVLALLRTKGVVDG